MREAVWGLRREVHDDVGWGNDDEDVDDDDAASDIDADDGGIDGCCLIVRELGLTDVLMSRQVVGRY
jgi:hypothetical protein